MPGPVADGHPLAGARRVLAMRLDNVGDVVMLGPSVRALRHALPAATLVAMLSPTGAQAAPLLPWIDEVLVHSAVWQDAAAGMPLDAARERALVERLRRGRFDAALVFTSFSQSPYAAAYACYLAGIPIRAAQARDFAGSVVTTWVKAGPDGDHQVDRNCALVEGLGIAVDDRRLEIRVPPASQASGDRLLAEAGVPPGSPFVLAAPGASCAARTYDAARMHAALRALGAEIPVVVVGTDRERARLGPLAAGPPRDGIVCLVGRTTVPELAGVIGRAAVLVTNNSGPLHLGDALRRPMVVLYSGTDLESQWAPRTSRAAILRRPTPCSPCYRFRCPTGLECLDVAPDEIVHAVRGLLP